LPKSKDEDKLPSSNANFEHEYWNPATPLKKVYFKLGGGGSYTAVTKQSKTSEQFTGTHVWRWYFTDSVSPAIQKKLGLPEKGPFLLAQTGGNFRYVVQNLDFPGPPEEPVAEEDLLTKADGNFLSICPLIE